MTHLRHPTSLKLRRTSLRVLLQVRPAPAYVNTQQTYDFPIRKKFADTSAGKPAGRHLNHSLRSGTGQACDISTVERPAQQDFLPKDFHLKDRRTGADKGGQAVSRTFKSWSCPARSAVEVRESRSQNKRGQLSPFLQALDFVPNVWYNI